MQLLLMLQPSKSGPLGESLLAPSVQFKKEAIRSIITILGFIIVYLLLVLLALAFVGLCLTGGIALIAFKPAFYTLLIGGGVIGCGVMVFVFLIKFLFATGHEDNSDSVEITEQDQPLLFETIYDLAKETGTSRPKKIFLSPDVNAAVFYNSSFWSMFLPVKKNLKIGLGLVNILNVSELKAVIAHEFGHFSQRSMKLGSWVYQVNKIIHDILFNNRGYANSLNSLASVHGIFAFFVQVTIYVVKGIQWVLHRMFGVVNKSYLSLSRQMEFHADLVAASVCGSNNIIHALQQSEFGETCFATTLDVCNAAWKDKRVVADFYTAHRTVVRHTARFNQLASVNGLPVLKDAEKEEVSARVNYKDQWASHPTLQERKAYLEPFGLIADVDTAPAWNLFCDENRWKEELTKQVYRTVPVAEISGTVEPPQFEALFMQQVQAFSYPGVFKEFYNNRIISSFDVEAVVKTPFVLQPFDTLLSVKAVLLPKRIHYLEQDLAVLQAINNGDIVTSSFDFDGQKYSRQQAAAVLAQLESEKEAVNKSLEALDQLLFRYFYAIAPLAEAEALKSAYNRYFEQRREKDGFAEKIDCMMAALGPVFRGETLTSEAVQALVTAVKGNHEVAFKQGLRYWLAAGAFDTDRTLKGAVEKFLLTQFAYFSGNSFFENELNELVSLVQDSWSGINTYVFSEFKTIAEKQAAILESKAQNVTVI